MSKQIHIPVDRKAHRVVTQHDIARVCGVSQKAVSLSLQGSSKVSDATRKRVLKAAEKLGYDPGANDAARRMRARVDGKRHRTDTVGVLLPRSFGQHPYYHAVLHGVLWVLSGLQVSVNVSYLVSPFTPEQVPKAARRGDLDGMVIVMPEAPADLELVLETLRSASGFASQPVSLALTSHPDYPYATADYEDGAYQSAKHLLYLGHRHILLQTLSANSLSEKQRKVGIARAFKEAGLAPRPHIHPFTIAEEWVNPTENREDETAEYQKANEGAKRKLWQLLCKHPEITAVLAFNDISAIHTYHLLQSHGKRIPDDYSIVGFDDVYPLPGAGGRNLLTSVKILLAEIGQCAAGLLMQDILGEPRKEYIIQPAALMVRHTTGPVRKA